MELLCHATLHLNYTTAKVSVCVDGLDEGKEGKEGVKRKKRKRLQGWFYAIARRVAYGHHGREGVLGGEEKIK